ncbi:MAG TPA: hypothetical protein VMD08_15760 [Candidatus Baltobacteraceae bacterium]|nr:hypothetical protein [Candidatus Baltobacteraceae bacterium]
MMRIGGLRDVVSLLLILYGALLVLAGPSAFIVLLRPQVPGLVLMFAMGVLLWRAGRAVRAGRIFGYWLAVAGLLLFALAPLLLGNKLVLRALLTQLVLIALVAASWRRESRTPAV